MEALFGDTYPLPSFYFKVLFGATLGMADTSFQEVSGIGTEISTDPVSEGGENRFQHNLPNGVKHGNLVLKRGSASWTSPLVLWCQSVFENDFMQPILTQPLIVQLMDELQLPVRAWMFTNCYPVKWSVSTLGSEKNELLIETVELSYTYSNRLI